MAQPQPRCHRPYHQERLDGCGGFAPGGRAEGGVEVAQERADARALDMDVGQNGRPRGPQMLV